MNVPCQIVHSAVQVFFERGDARLGSLDSCLSGPGGAHADFGEALRLIAELTDGFLVQTAKGRPFVLDQPFEILETPGGIALKPGGDVVPVVEFCFKLTDGTGVPLARLGPLLDDVRASFGENGQVLLDRVGRIPGFSQLLER